MPLTWTASKPAPSPFEAIAGDRTEYQVHYAECRAADSADLEIAIAEIIQKALSFFDANKGERAKRLLFLWDVVYATLTVVYTDDSMMYDAHHVAKCYFPAFDKLEPGNQANFEAAKRLSHDIRQIIESTMTHYRHGRGFGNLPIYFSDVDRASSGVGFSAQQLPIG